MPRLSLAQREARQRIGQLAGSGMFPERLASELLAALHQAIPSDDGGLVGLDPTTLLHNRLLAVDENRLLEGFRKRPGRQTWDGEHVGKWLHAATLAWVNTGRSPSDVSMPGA